MANGNRIKIRHGTGTPTTSNLLSYELGWNGEALFINNNGLIKKLFGDSQSFTDLSIGNLVVTGGASFINIPTAPTAASGTNNTQLATTAFVNTAITSKFNNAALTGVPTAPTAASSTNSTQIATTAFVHTLINGIPSNYLPLSGGTLTGPVTTSSTFNMGMGDFKIKYGTTSPTNVTLDNNDIYFYIGDPISGGGGGSSVIPGTGLILTSDGILNHSNSIIQQSTSAIYPIKIDSEGHIYEYGDAVVPLTASSSLSATKITGTVAIANGGTGASTAANARTNLGLGTMATETASNYITKATLSGAYDIMYSSSANTPTRLAANTTSTRKFLRMKGTGSAGAAPAWDTVTKSDVGLDSVENTALSTWTGSANITTIGTIGTGTVPLANISGADDIKAIEALTGTSGLLKKTAANTWTLDTTAYTSNTGTVTKVTAGTGLAVGTTAGGNFTTAGTINHINSISAQTTQALYPIKIDTCGHITAYGTAVTSLPASDVYEWAKASTKPSYALSEITGADDVKAIEALTGTTGFLKKTGVNQWTLDTNAGGTVGNGKIFYGTCSTAAATGEKAIVCDSFTSSDLTAGTIILVKFTNTNTAAASNLKLNINSTGANIIYEWHNGSYSSITNKGYLAANQVYEFIYNGTYWVVQFFYDIDTTYTFDGTYNASTNPAATVSTVTNAIGNAIGGSY